MRFTSIASLLFAGPALAQSTTTTGSSSASTSSAFLPVIEVDVIFPRNETYQETEILPLAINVQRLNEARNIGELRFSWHVDIYDTSNTFNVYNWLDSGLFVAANTTGDDGNIQIAYTNMTSWIDKLNTTSHLVFGVTAIWNFTYMCDHPADGGLTMTEIIFRVESDVQRGFQPDNSSIPADIAQAPACPEFAAVMSDFPGSSTYEGYAYVSHSTITEYTTCTTLFDVEWESSLGTPCASTMAEATLSSLGSIASSLATGRAEVSAASRSSKTAKPTSTDSSNAAVATGAGILHPALAAVAVVYCVIYN